MTHMMYEGSFFLCVKRLHRQNKFKFRVAAKQPNLEAGEVAIHLSVSLPQALFQRPMLRASVIVPADKVTPTTIDASVAHNIAELVRQELDLNMRIVIEDSAP